MFNQHTCLELVFLFPCKSAFCIAFILVAFKININLSKRFAANYFVETFLVWLWKWNPFPYLISSGFSQFACIKTVTSSNQG